MKMKIWFCCLAFCCAIFTTVCVAQIDIYQSDAYSVEEMCAREAEQNTALDYNEAYESCISNNRDNPMYQSEPINNDLQNPDEHHTDDTRWIDNGERQNVQDFPQD